VTFPYTVQPGDYLVAIAKKFGFPTWQEIYRHPENAPFRAKRPNPDKIYPGDVIRIPVSFTAETTFLRTTPPPAVIVDPHNPNHVTTQSFVAQFQWGVRVTMRPVGGDFQVGFIQNVLSFNAAWVYMTNAKDTSPRTVTATLNVLPCLDNKRTAVTVWTKDRFVQMGALPLKNPPPVAPREDTADLFTDDTPGGSVSLVHTADPTRTLASLAERMTLITWIAVREAGSPEREVGSYQFLRHVLWGFTRRATVTSTSPFAAGFTTNRMTSAEGEGVGSAPGTPVLNPPLPTSPGVMQVTI
jgi:hypothetical protein